MKPSLLGIGGAHVDRRGTMNADYIYGASIPGKMIEEAGGGVFNALRTAVQFQIDCSLLSVRGGDPAGDIVANELQRSKIEDLSSVFLDRSTASYTALLTKDGDVVAALADMSIYESALPRQLSRRKTREAIHRSQAILIDANMPKEAIAGLINRCEGKPVYAIAISPAKVIRLRPVLHKLDCLFLNHREAHAILSESGDTQNSSSADIAEKLLSMGLKHCVLTNGADEICIADRGKITTQLPLKADRIVDVTGAGDALAGATIAALMKGETLANAVQHGLVAATITVGTAQAIADFSDKTQFAQLLAKMKTQSID